MRTMAGIVVSPPDELTVILTAMLEVRTIFSSF